MTTDFQHDVFLSHNQADKPRVRRLAERWRTAGPFKFGTRNSEFGIPRLCLSPAALGSDWVGLERSTVLFRDPANAAAGHATSEIAFGSKLGFDATKKLPGEGFNRAWPPLIKMDESVKAKVEMPFTL
jgi:hypothetical protein